MTLRKARNNIIRVYEKATEAERAAGTNWYPEAREFAVELSIRYNISVKAVAHVIAALSPNITWDQNKRAARIVIDECSHSRYWIASVPGYPANIEKARWIAHNAIHGVDWAHLLSGPKVTAFADNILHPPSSNSVTVDVHALSIADGVRYTSKTAPKLTPKQYEFYADVYRKTAAQLELTPLELQAITWVIWRRLIKEKV